ncbi:Enoyl-(Acyl carrier protein) reductase-like protein 25 [Elsinoe fawcettii]|nr:Enoyl-(Acyl carrier protein) reductase-like protein 25 [Elsinoe fawcettii]
MAANGNSTGPPPITQRFDLRQKSFLITGGGRGIGLACAEAIAQLGGNIAVIDRAAEPDAEFQSLGKQYNVKTIYAQGDVTDQVSLELAFDQCVGALGSLHGGLTAAGICSESSLLDTDWNTAKSTFEVNILGTYWTIKLLAKHFVDKEIAGSIVTIASINGHGLYVPVQPLSAYNASKAAIKGLMGPLAGELGAYGIRVNSISPGAIKTPLLARLKGEKQHILNWYTNGSALKRLGLPSDLTPMVCYLLSDASAFTTGADMVISGGLHAGPASSPV